MMAAAVILMVLSAGIVLTLGVIHLVYTFSGAKLTPRDPVLRARMSETSLVITKEMTVWRAWVGFNASHSMGAVLFGLIYGFLAIVHGRLLFGSPYLLIVGFAMLGGLLVLARTYWFRVPLAGIGISLGCYLASVAASRV